MINYTHTRIYSKRIVAHLNIPAELNAKRKKRSLNESRKYISDILDKFISTKYGCAKPAGFYLQFDART